MAVCRFSIDAAILLESMWKVNRQTILSLWVGGILMRPSISRSRGIIVIWDSQALELIDSGMGVFHVLQVGVYAR